MGTYLTPGNSGFQEVVQSEYVDKTGLIDLVNRTVGTKNKLTCVSRPHRFGKSFAAQMLCAYYDCSCDSHELFDDKVIAKTEGYMKHLNQYYVINLDITSFISEARILENIRYWNQAGLKSLPVLRRMRSGGCVRSMGCLLKRRGCGMTVMIFRQWVRFTILILLCVPCRTISLVPIGKRIVNGYSCLAYAEKCADDILHKSKKDTVTLLDGDKTLIVEDSSSAVFGYITHLYDGNFYTGYQAWRQNEEFGRYAFDGSVELPVHLNEKVRPALAGDSFLLTSGHKQIWALLSGQLGLACYSGWEMSAETKLLSYIQYGFLQILLWEQMFVSRVEIRGLILQCGCSILYNKIFWILIPGYMQVILHTD